MVAKLRKSAPKRRRVAAPGGVAGGAGAADAADVGVGEDGEVIPPSLHRGIQEMLDAEEAAHDSDMPVDANHIGDEVFLLETGLAQVWDEDDASAESAMAGTNPQPAPDHTASASAASAVGSVGLEAPHDEGDEVSDDDMFGEFAAPVALSVAETILSAGARAWQVEYSHSLSALRKSDNSPRSMGQRNLSLMLLTRRPEAGSVVLSVSYVHWIWSHQRQPLTGEELRLMWGRQVDVRDGRVIASSELTHPKEAFLHDRMLVSNVGAAMTLVKAKQERDLVDGAVARFKLMVESSVAELQPCSGLADQCVYCQGAHCLCDAGECEVFTCSFCLHSWHARCSVRAAIPTQVSETTRRQPWVAPGAASSSSSSSLPAVASDYDNPLLDNMHTVCGWCKLGVPQALRS